MCAKTSFGSGVAAATRRARVRALPAFGIGAAPKSRRKLGFISVTRDVERIHTIRSTQIERRPVSEQSDNAIRRTFSDGTNERCNPSCFYTIHVRAVRDEEVDAKTGTTPNRSFTSTVPEANAASTPRRSPSYTLRKNSEVETMLVDCTRAKHPLEFRNILRVRRGHERRDVVEVPRRLARAVDDPRRRVHPLDPVLRAVRREELVA
ncbi:hypothetical protein AURANDRAFT_66946 [Aureococcus anophagefferens]|uniref:Uncharacterized protein n=1 Tax=Aureococcus anophagefferens TaxID=44056 RepID=F0YJE0_AURAN|nr:hypothetical protein AURANDRAFT_66946 [Aureococcus anophagefferens]EGB04773.1 hypothetical protein AURANDRAFT_66946 [Aureococcus anophagefferens]|eukprot:XP_009040510.1 hypothetical protein AURANDRAFT_66946 [Aureococcus anophagefferens]